MSEIGLYDVDSHNYPNLPLMKLSAWHKQQGDHVEWLNYFKHYDKVYVSKVFGDEYSQMDNTCINADEIVFGGTGFAITIEGGGARYITKIGIKICHMKLNIYIQIIHFIPNLLKTEHTDF